MVKIFTLHLSMCAAYIFKLSLFCGCIYLPCYLLNHIPTKPALLKQYCRNLPVRPNFNRLWFAEIVAPFGSCLDGICVRANTRRVNEHRNRVFAGTRGCTGHRPHTLVFMAQVFDG